VLISAVIPWAVFTRYVLNSAASWPEPLAVLLTIVLTFIGAAAGYRLKPAHERFLLRGPVAGHIPQAARSHRSGSMALSRLHDRPGRRLVEVTGTIPSRNFPFLSVGVTYCRSGRWGPACCCSSSSAFPRGAPPIRCLALPKLCRSTDSAEPNMDNLHSARDHAGLLSLACPSPIRWRFAAIAGAWSIGIPTGKR